MNFEISTYSDYQRPVLFLVQRLRKEEQEREVRCCMTQAPIRGRELQKSLMVKQWELKANLK